MVCMTLSVEAVQSLPTAPFMHLLPPPRKRNRHFFRLRIAALNSILAVKDVRVAVDASIRYPYDAFVLSVIFVSGLGITSSRLNFRKFTSPKLLSAQQLFL